MNTHSEFPNIPFSDDKLLSTQESATENSPKFSRQSNNLTINVFFANNQLQKLTDEVLNLNSLTQLHILFANTLLEYIYSLRTTLAFKKELSEVEINTFFIHFYIALLPVFSLGINLNLNLQVVISRLQDLIELYLSFKEMTTSCRHLTNIKWSEIYPERAKKIEEFLNRFNSDKFKAISAMGSIPGEALVSELVAIYSKTMKFLSEKEILEAKISTKMQIRNIAEVFEGLVDKITYQISAKRSLDLQITNIIATNTFNILLAILESKPLSRDYWELVSELQKEPFDLNFLAYLLSLNCKTSSSEGLIRQKISIVPTLKMKQGKASLVSENSVEQYDFEIQLIADPKHDTEQTSLDFLQEFDQTLTEILKKLLDSKHFGLVAESFVVFFEGITQVNSSKRFLTAFSQKKKFELYVILNTTNTILEALLNAITSPELYKRILRIILRITQNKFLNSVESKESISDLWEAIEEIAKFRPECSSYLISVQIENLQHTIEQERIQAISSNIFSGGELFEKVIQQFDILKELIAKKRLDVRSKQFEVIEVVWSFMNKCHGELIINYKAYFRKLINTICNLTPVLYQFMLTETLVVQVFQKCFTQEKKIIIFYLMENLYKRIQFNEDDDNLDSELRKRVFYCFRRYSETIKSCCYEGEFGCKVFSFILRFYTSLIEEQNIESFEAFFEKKCQLYHQETIFNARRSNDSQMILLAFVEYYKNLLEVALSDGIININIAKDLLKLTSSILLISPKLHAVLLELDTYSKLYGILSTVHREYHNEDVFEIANILFNLITKGYYHFIVEKPIMSDHSRKLEEQIASLNYDEHAPMWKYIPIKEHYFVSLLLKCLFEWNVSRQVKSFYLKILESMMENSLSNAGVCAQSDVLERMILYMKIETDQENKKLLKQLIFSVLRVGVNVSQIKAFMRCFRFNYSDYHQNYLKSLVSEFARNDFVEKMRNVNNYVLTMSYDLKILREVLVESEDNENFMNFSGEHSGIIISNLNQSLKSNMTFLITFRIENSISCDRRNMISNYKILKENISNENHVLKQSCLASLDCPIEINYNYLESSKSAGMISNDKMMLRNSLVVDNNELFYPRIFSIAGNGITLELIVGIQNRKRCLILEGKKKKEGSITKEYKDYYEYCPRENEWCTIFLTFSSKNGFQMHLVNNDKNPDEVIRRIAKSTNGPVSQIVDQFGNVQDFSIGTSPPKFVTKFKFEEESTLTVENSFSGQIKKFYLIKRELSEPEMANVALRMKARSDNANMKEPQIEVKKGRKSILQIFGSKTVEILDYEQFEAQALLNLNAFPDLNRVGAEEENQWMTVSKRDDKNTHSIISVQDIIEKTKSRFPLFDRAVEKKHEIRAKGVTYLEKGRFEDVLFSIGNLEIILYMLELLSQFDENKFEKEHRHKILCEIIRIIEVLCKSSNSEDVMIFLSQNNGFQFISRLLQNYVSKYGVNKDVVGRLVELIKSIPNSEDRYRGFMQVLFNFDIWKDCSFTIKNLVIERAYETLTDPSIYFYFKKHYAFTSVLLQLQLIMRDEPPSLPRPRTGNSPIRQIPLKWTGQPQDQFSDILIENGKHEEDHEAAVYKEKIRSTILYVLSNPLDVANVSPDIEQKEKVDPIHVTDRECEKIVKSLGSCNPTAFLLDFLQLILKVLDTENKWHLKEFKESLHKHKIQDIIFSFIYYAKLKRESSPLNSKRRLTHLNERMLTIEELDSLLYYCLQISRILIFENQPGERYENSMNTKLDEASLRRANLLLADFLFGASVNLDSANEMAHKERYSTYLKLYNHCLTQMEPLTFKALIRTIIQVRKNEKLEKVPAFRKDYKAIGLVFEKFIKREINLPERKIFLKELYAVLGSRYSLKIFVQVPNYLHLLHDLLNLDPNGDASDDDVRAWVQKILRKFIFFALFEDDQQRIFDLIALIEFHSHLYSTVLKPTEQLSKREDAMLNLDQKSSSHNFFKLVKPIEFTLKEYRDKSQKKNYNEESKANSGSISDKKLDNFNAKRSIVPNIAQFVYYIEHFLLKSAKNIEQEEVQIVQFTTILFDFLYETQILYVIYPSMKPIPPDISANALSKKYEGICYRNGGLLLSLLTILFTVLQNARIISEKISLLKCCSIIFDLHQSNRISVSNISKPNDGTKSTPLNTFKELLMNAAKRHPVSEIKKDMSTQLVDSVNPDKLPDLLVQKDLLLIYEFFFHGLFKLIYNELSASKINAGATKNLENIGQKEEIRKTGEDLKEPSSQNSSLSKIYTNELIMLLIEIVSVSGIGIRNTLNQYYTSDSNVTKCYFSIKKSCLNQSMAKKNITETENRNKNNLTSIKIDIEKVCDYHSEQVRPIKRQETNSTPDKITSKQSRKLKIDELFTLCNPEFSAPKSSKSITNGFKMTRDPKETLVAITSFIQNNKDELRNEISITLRNSSLKVPKLVI